MVGFGRVGELKLLTVTVKCALLAQPGDQLRLNVNRAKRVTTP